MTRSEWLRREHAARGMRYALVSALGGWHDSPPAGGLGGETDS